MDAQTWVDGVDEVREPALRLPGTRMGTPIGVEVLLAHVDPARMAALVEASWRHRAPRHLINDR